MIKVENLVKKYNDFEALKGLTFTVAQGEIIGLLGPNGAGKTTTMRILAGFMPATSGTVMINNIDIHEDPQAIKQITGYLPETPPLYTDMRIKDYLKFTAEIKKVPRKKIPNNIEFVLNAAGITDRADQIISQLSKGYKQRVGLAMALINDPKILILDEPTIGLDPNQIIEIRSLIKKQKDERTVILSSHILPEVSQTCSRIIIIAAGKIIALDTEDSLQKSSMNEASIIVKISTDNKLAAKIIKDSIPVKSITEIGKHTLKINSENDEKIKSQIAKILIENNIELYELHTEEMTLEKIFQKLTTEER